MATNALLPNPFTSALSSITQTQQQQAQQQQQMQAAQTSRADQSGSMPQPPPEYIRSLIAIGNMHQAKQAMAQQKIGEYDRLQGAGISVAPKAIQKAYKQAGIPVDTSPEGIKTAIAYYQQYQSEKDPNTGIQQELPKENALMLEKAKNGTLNQKDMASFATGAMIRHEMRSARWQHYDETQKELVQRQLTEEQHKLFSDDTSPEQKGVAFARLQAGIKGFGEGMSQDDKAMLYGGPEARQFVLGKMKGAEPPQELHARADRLYEANIAAGMGAGNARKAADAQAAGEPLPAGVQLPDITPQNLSMTMQNAAFALQLGLSGESLSNFVHTSLTGGLDAAMQTLPKGFQTLSQQQLQLEKDRLKTEQQRTGIEAGQLQVSEYDATTRRLGVQASVEEREAEAAHLGLSLKNERDKNLLDQFAVIEKLKDQGKLTKELETQFMEAFASSAGMKVEQVQGLFGSYVDFKPGDANTSGAAGKSRTKPENESFSPALKFLRGLTGQTTNDATSKSSKGPA
jgi:hypothetical protein